MADPVSMRSAADEILGGVELASVAGCPEGVGDGVGGGGGIGVAVGFEFGHEAEGGGLPDVGAGSTCDEAAGGAPGGEGDGVGERREAADEAAEGFDIGSVVEEGIEGFDVVTAGGPVEGRFGMGQAEGAGVDVGSEGDERRDGLANAGEVAGPIGGDVEEGTVAVGPGGGEGGVGGQEAVEGGSVPSPNRFDDIFGHETSQYRSGDPAFAHIGEGGLRGWYGGDSDGPEGGWISLVGGAGSGRVFGDFDDPGRLLEDRSGGSL